ncbi:hypothetical protein K439DRAFT_377202 [Ramaria rubella]|nr:hypothetical protein K439DRAFT_377202 [Ramaria rubella]
MDRSRSTLFGLTVSGAPLRWAVCVWVVCLRLGHLFAVNSAHVQLCPSCLFSTMFAVDSFCGDGLGLGLGQLFAIGSLCGDCLDWGQLFAVDSFCVTTFPS